MLTKTFRGLIQRKAAKPQRKKRKMQEEILWEGYRFNFQKKNLFLHLLQRKSKERITLEVLLPSLKVRKIEIKIDD